MKEAIVSLRPGTPRTLASPGLALGLGTACYVAAVFAIERAHLGHAHVWLVVAEHAILLPAVALYLARAPSTPVSSRLVGALSLALAVAYAIGWIVLALHWSRGILWGDESAYRFTAQTFASGHLTAPAPHATSADAALSHTELRFTHHILHGGRWFTKYPPLWPAVLAIGYLVHAPWLVGPALGAATLAVLHRVAKDELGLATPSLAVLLVAASPFFFLMSASSMSHALSGLLVVSADWALLRGLRTRRLAPLAAAIALGAACVFVRPFTAFCLFLAAGPFTVAVLMKRRERRLLVEVLGVALAAGALVVALMGLYNRFYTGSATLSPYALYRGTSVPVEVSLRLSTIVRSLHTTALWSIDETLAFSFPLLGALALWALVADREHRAANAYLVGAVAVFWAANLVQPEGSASRFGDRYVYEAWLGLALVAARGASHLVERGRVAPSAMVSALGVLAMVGLVQGAVLVRPVLAEMAPYVHVHDFVSRLAVRDAVVFFPITSAFTGDRMNLNGPAWPSAEKLYLVDPGPSRRAAVTRSQGRSRFVVVGWDDAAGSARVLASGPAAP